ncbi:MAG: hypothetical protein IAE97_06285 [Chthoniobacterales bacterium]|nr:hypothetical protein [Chthoniobacterales bacterium]
MSESRHKAAEDLEHILALKKFRPFADYHQRRLGEKIAALEVTILENEDLPAEELIILRRIRKALVELADMPAVDEASCQKILATP